MGGTSSTSTPYYRRAHAGTRSYTWVKNTLQRSGLVAKAPGRGKHRRRRERAPLRGMMLHQDGSTHEWVPGQHWDLIITLDDATSEHYSMSRPTRPGRTSPNPSTRRSVTPSRRGRRFVPTSRAAPTARAQSASNCCSCIGLAPSRASSSTTRSSRRYAARPVWPAATCEATEVDPFQWTVYVLGFMQLPGGGSRSPWVSDSPAPGDDGAGYTILR